MYGRFMSQRLIKRAMDDYDSADNGSLSEQRSTVVQFHDEVTNCDSPIEFITEEEAENMWYTVKELGDISKEDAHLLKVARQFGLNDRPNEFCIRGLEHAFSRRSKIEVRARRVALMQAVFHEQQSQALRNMNDPSRIRRKSVVASKPARQLAAERGRQDEMEARALIRARKPRYRRSNSCFVDRKVLVEMEKVQIDHISRTITL